MSSSHVAGLTGCFPQVGGQAEFMQDGWDSLVVLLDESWIVRIPRTPSTAARAVTEFALLDLLAERLSVAVPDPVATCREHGAMLYPRIPGRPLAAVADDAQVHRLATLLTVVLNTLHRTPLKEARTIGVLDLSGTGWGDAYQETCDQFRARVVPLLPEPERVAGRALLDCLVERVSDPTIADSLVHRDLGPAHVLCDDGQLTGIIDWTDACIGDPAIDLAWVLHGSPTPLAHALQAALQVDADVQERSRLYHQLRPWYEVVHGLDHGRDELVTSGRHGVLDRLQLSGR